MQRSVMRQELLQLLMMKVHQLLHYHLMLQQLLKMEVVLLTLTATSSIATYEDITVTVQLQELQLKEQITSAISDITISAGSTTGTASFTPSNDTLYENSETAIIDIAVSGGGASESGTQQLTLTITDEALDSGTQATYNSSLASAWLSQTQSFLISEALVIFKLVVTQVHGKL